MQKGGKHISWLLIDSIAIADLSKKVFLKKIFFKKCLVESFGLFYTATPLRMKKMIAESTAAVGTVMTHAATIFFTIPRFT